MHLLVHMQLRQPGPFFRAMVLLSQVRVHVTFTEHMVVLFRLQSQLVITSGGSDDWWSNVVEHSAFQSIAFMVTTLQAASTSHHGMKVLWPVN